MVTTAILILWVFYGDGTQTYTTKDEPSLEACMNAEYEDLKGTHPMEGPDATFAAGCIVHQQRVS